MVVSEFRAIFSSRDNIYALISLLPLAAWIYSRVWMVNPAILGDEYLYSVNARKAAPWDPSPAGDFSNYLFNLVYSSTNLCGEGFYTCGKALNILFFLAFAFILFTVARRYVPFLGAFGFMLAVGLSPLSVYTSMFLPESMYMFFMGILLVAVLRAIDHYSSLNWAIVGAVIGLASLVKPHAWLSSIAVALTLLVVGLGGRDIGIRKTAQGFVGLVLGAILARGVIGLLIAGPKALGFFGQYFGASTIEQVVGVGSDAESQSLPGSSPMSTVFSLFGAQLNVHVLTVVAFLAISMVALISSIIEIIRTRKMSSANSIALFAFIWLVSLMIEIVIFTGWVTGTGDDHTTRVLLRYYEFLFAIVPLAAIVALYKGVAERTNVLFRWGLFGTFALLLSPAFTGFFATLTIQIADAPTLAGLVVNSDVFNAAAIIGFAGLLVFATFPRYTVWVFVLLLPVTMAGTGFQIQDQYIGFRGQLSDADKAGFYLRDSHSDYELEKTLILAPSRFEATNVAFWADHQNIKYQLTLPDSVLTETDLPMGTRIVVALAGIKIESSKFERESREGYDVYLLGTN